MHGRTVRRTLLAGALVATLVPGGAAVAAAEAPTFAGAEVMPSPPD